MRYRIKHYRTDISGAVPTPDNVEYGEIAINYAEGSESLFIKNSNDEIVNVTQKQDMSEYLTSEDANRLYVKRGEYSELDNKVNTPLDDETPKIFWQGELPTAKADGEYQGILTYVSKNQTFTAYATLTVQGNSSVNFAKKNFTIKFYTDDTYTIKRKIEFKDWGTYDSFVMKANWSDHSHVRIVATSELWKQSVESRSDFDTLPEELKSAPGHGATLGWSFRFWVNSLYYGLYEMIIAKKFIFGQDKSNPLHSILISEYNNRTLCAFSESVWTKTEFDTCWAEELQTSVPETAYERFGGLIRLINEGTDEDVLAELPNYVDIQSVIDFDIFARLFILRDSIGKNQIFATYDGIKFYEGAWDLDWSLNGSSSAKWQEDYVLYQEAGIYNKLYNRIEQLYFEDFKARYWELRNSVLSYNNISSVFEKYNDCVEPWLEEDYASTTGKGQFTTIPVNGNNIQQIRNNISYRLLYMDNVISNMVKKVKPVTITVDKANQLFTLSCETEDATIYYTLDGTEPTTGSTQYTGETAFEFNTTLNAIAIKEGSDASDILTYLFEPVSIVELYPVKRVYQTVIRANEKDVVQSNTIHLDIYENKPENYTLYIKGKYLNTAAKYAYVNADFLDNPTTENLLNVEGKYQYVSGMVVPEQVDTEITEYYDAPYIAICVIEQGNNVTIPEIDRFKLYTYNQDAELILEKATPVATVSSKNFNVGTLVESWGNYDMLVYNNVIGKAPYIIEGQQMIRNSNKWAFANESFISNPTQDNILSVSTESYPYKGDQVEPLYYKTAVPLKNIDETAPYIVVATCTNANIDQENRIVMYYTKPKQQ